MSGNDVLQYWEEDDATEVVLLYLESIGNPRKFSRIARRVSLRKPIIAVRSGRTTQGVPMGQIVRQIAAPQRAVDAMFKQAGVIQVDTLDEMFDVAQLLAHQPLPRGRRVAIVGNSDAIGLLASDAASAVGLVVNRSVSLGADATAEDFEDALDAAIDDPDVDSVVAVYVPPLNTSGEDVARCWPRWASSPTSPSCRRSWGRRACPSCSASPTWPARAQAAARCRRTPRSSRPSARSPPSSGTPCGCARRTARPPRSTGVDPAAAKKFVNQVLIEHPDGRDLDQDELRTLLACYGIELWGATPVSSLRDALKAGKELGWDVVLKATADRLRERPDLAHVWRNIDTQAEMRQAWRTLNEIITDPASAGFVVQKNAPPGIPVTVASIEDPLFGPVVSFGISGPLTELLEDRSYRIPPLGERDAEAMVREIKAAPILFGYRGSEAVDVAEVEQLVQRVAQLQHDIPQLASLDLSLVLAGAEGLTVLTAFGRVEPVADPRSDWFVRRLPDLADTIPG